jgi:anti-sigma regulatory factor (Ser/Thr protein kinase)
LQLIHDAFVYASDDDYLASMVPFVRDGIDDGAAVIAVTVPRNESLLRAALGPHADGVTFVDARTWFPRPATTVATYHSLFMDRLDAGARNIRVIGEVQFGASSADHREWMCYESILNRSFAQLPGWIVCPYDTRELPPDVIDSAPRTHPFVSSGDSRGPSDVYEAPNEYVARVQPRDDMPTRRPELELALTDDVVSIRKSLSEVVVNSGVEDQRRDLFVLACNELVTNAVVHGGGTGRIRVWVDADGAVCEVADAGPGLHDTLVGYLPPGSDSQSGRGLWLAHQLCDAVRVNPSAAGGLSVVISAKRG